MANKHEKMLKIAHYSVQFSSVNQSCLTLCDPMNLSTPCLPVHHQLPEFTQTHVHQAGDAIKPSHPLASPSPPAPNPSSIKVFSNESTLHMRWPKYWSFIFSIIPSKEHPGLEDKRNEQWQSENESPSVVSDSLQCHGLYSPWNSPGQNTGVGTPLFLLQGIFPTEGSNPGLPHCEWILYQMSHKGTPNNGNNMFSLL